MSKTSQWDIHRRCIAAILAWNKEKSWHNFQQLRRDCYVRFKHEPRLWHSAYTLVRTTWKVLNGKYRRCEAQWREDGTLKYYGLDCA